MIRKRRGRRRVPGWLTVILLSTWTIPSASLSQDLSRVEEEGGKVHAAIRRSVPRVVKVIGASGIRNVLGKASGTIVSAEGHILTLDGVMLKTANLRVVLSDGRILKGKVLRRDKERSIALVKVDPEEPLPYFPPEDAGPPRVGQWVLSVANPFQIAEGDEWPSVNLGIVSAVTRLDLRLGLHDFPYSGDVIVTDATNNPGGFGGALVDIQGRLIGINGRCVESKETNTQISYAVPIGDLIPLIQGTAADGGDEGQAVVPGRHGIRLFDLGTRKSPPAYVATVEEGSPAARAGLRRDDLIIRCAAAPVRSCKEFQEIMARLGPGEEVAITFKRGKKIAQAVIRLEGPPEEEGR